MNDSTQLAMIDEVLSLLDKETPEGADALLDWAVARAAHVLHVTDATDDDRRAIAALAYEQIAAAHS